MLADVFKAAGKLDCLKSEDVLILEELQYTPFHTISLILFICAIIHTLCVDKIHHFARAIEAKQAPKRIAQQSPRSIGVQMLYFLAEVEIVFAIWAIPLFLFMASFKGWHVALEYINTRDYTEALFIVIVLSIASTKPIIQCAQRIIHFLAQGIGGSLSAWWFTLLTVGPLLGSFITEAGAMAISAMLFERVLLLPSQFQTCLRNTRSSFHKHLGRRRLNDLCLACRPHLIPRMALDQLGYVCDLWLEGGLRYLIANGIYWFYFRKEFAHLNKRKRAANSAFDAPPKDPPVPFWVVTIHLIFLGLIVLSSHYPAIFFATYLFFIGMYQATKQHQCALKLARPLLVGLFIAGLVIHGGLQGWWVSRMLNDLSPLQVLGMAMGLTAFNDNAAIAYLATLIPDWNDVYQYALLTGAIAGGGLTVIANAPNPAGFVILASHFGGSVSSFKLALAALIPATVLYVIFSVFGPLFF